MLAFCAPYGDGAKRDQVISITDRLLPWEVTRAGGTKDYFPGGDANYRAVSNVLGLNTIHFGEDVRAAENMEFISQGSMNNGLCFVGPHRKYNPFSNQYHELVPGQGHFGPGEFNAALAYSSMNTTNLTDMVCLLRLQMLFLEMYASRPSRTKNRFRSFLCHALFIVHESDSMCCYAHRRGGVAARRCRSRAPATRWSRWRRPRMRRW
jgi:hypothetical protein